MAIRKQVQNQTFEGPNLSGGLNLPYQGGDLPEIPGFDPGSDEGLELARAGVAPAEPGDDPTSGDEGRGAETPRERTSTPRAPGLWSPQSGSTPPRPKVPTPMAGSTSPGPVPFQPMGGGMGSLFGIGKGLQGGGLGMQGATSQAASDPVAGILEWLMKNKGQGGGVL